MSDLKSVEQIDKLLQECIDFLSRKRDLKDDNEIIKDIVFVQERFDDIKPNLIGAWSSIVIVNKAHDIPDEIIKHLMVVAYKSGQDASGT